MVTRICVFCGSSPGSRTIYGQQAKALGRLLAAKGIGLVYGGGNVGLMGIIADAVIQASGEVIGIIPRALLDAEIGHQGLSELRVVGSMHERKAMMAELSDAFIALPGGFGTFEEFCEVVTWSQLGLHRKACGLLNVAGYYDSLLALFDHAVQEGFLKPEHRSLVISDDDPEQLIYRIQKFEPPETPKWITKNQRELL
jgi:uncharacterized protein (TIGR00730 family)